MTVTPGDAARLLALVQGFNGRTVGEIDAIAWSDALKDLEPEACAEGIRDFYRHRTGWVMPADIRGYINRKKREDAERRHADRLHTELPPMPPPQSPAFLAAKAAYADALDAAAHRRKAEQQEANDASA